MNDFTIVEVPCRTMANPLPSLCRAEGKNGTRPDPSCLFPNARKNSIWIIIWVTI